MPSESTLNTLGYPKWSHFVDISEYEQIPRRHEHRYLSGILASAIYPMNSSILEGVNNRIKVIKRMEYGFRDSAYFFLKIKAAFPGKAR